MNRDLIARQLRGKGHEVIFAADGGDAVRKAESETPDLVLMDVGLPVMSGIEATQAIRLNPRMKDLPIIALTAYAMQGDQEIVLAAGCDDYDTKPIELSRLLGKIRALLLRQTSS